MINYKDLEYKANAMRKNFDVSQNEYFDIEHILENINDFTIVYLEMSDNISGLCIKEDSNKIIAVNTNLSKGRQRFTLAHELCHLFYHDEGCYICSSVIEKDKTDKNKEYEADIFASYLLAPTYIFTEKYLYYYQKYNNNLLAAVDLEHTFCMSHKAILTRLLFEKLIKKEEYDKYSITSPMGYSHKLGLSVELYKPTRIIKTVGKYIRLSNKLYEEEKISSSKYEQLLLDAFRDDLVYGEDEIDEID